MSRFVACLVVLSIALIGDDCYDDHCDHDFFFIVPPPANAPPAADLNLDGYADLVIGAPLDDGGGAPGSQRGAVFIHFGSATGPSPAPGLTIFGQEDGAHFGASIAFVGDVNGHGAPDLLVGAPLDDGDGNSTDEGIDRGRAFIFFGGPAMDATPDVVMTGAEPGAEFGTSVARVADTNGDGFDDWLVGAPFDDGDGNGTDEGTDRGRAFFFYGSSTPDGVPDVTFTGPEVGSQFGYAVDSAGDINHGGAEDIAVGAPLDDGDGNATDEGTDRGRVYIFFGGSALDANPDLILTGDEDGAHFGAAVAVALDVNNDGVDDLVVGAPLHDAGGGAGADRGRAYVYFGGSPPDANADITISGTENGGMLGAAVSRAGDANGDGVADFLVGAPLEDPGGLVDAGRAYLFFGGSAVDGIPDLTLNGTETRGHFGAAVA
ncbi:MAG TPA: integrin alpha, partial [Myxococcota bacterium]|nr:integrin alpha [Myxococcota bacterium]